MFVIIEFILFSMVCIFIFKKLPAGLKSFIVRTLLRRMISTVILKGLLK